MVNKNTSPYGTGFTISIEARCGVTTGISAADRATTILAAVAEHARPSDLVRPGHIFPLRARDGGTMVRAGQTEGSVDLARLAQLKPAGVICEIMDDDGTMARMPSLEKFSQKHGIGICTIADLIEYRMRAESFIERVVETEIPTTHAGRFKVIVYENDIEDLQYVALIKGEISPDDPILVRVHSECMPGDIFGSMRCDCHAKLRQAMQMIDKEGQGVFLYIRQEGKGIGLVNKIKAYAAMDENQPLADPLVGQHLQSDMRSYGIGAQVLVDLGIRQMKLISNNAKKMIGLQGYGLSIVEQVSIEVEPSGYNQCYVECRKLKLGQVPIT
jgi:3,4-dihydroxy 2-butanone 4-phosphate synthase/GTP cyclohydrolase II